MKRSSAMTVGIVAAVCLAGTLNAAEGFLPSAPVVDFRLPFFDEHSGDRIRLLRGDRGWYEADRFRVEGLVLEIYERNRPGMPPEIVITSPEAWFPFDDDRIRGPGYLSVIDRDGRFSIAGRDWTWSNYQRRLSIGEEARVTFRQAVGDWLSVHPHP